MLGGACSFISFGYVFVLTTQCGMEEWRAIIYKLSIQAMQKLLEPRENSGLIAKCLVLSSTVLISCVKPLPIQKVT